jgi:hypothetical protein
MPIKKPLQAIKKKLGLAPTFEQKRKALGVERVPGNRHVHNLKGSLEHRAEISHFKKIQIQK